MGSRHVAMGWTTIAGSAIANHLEHENDAAAVCPNVLPHNDLTHFMACSCKGNGPDGGRAGARRMVARSECSFSAASNYDGCAAADRSQQKFQPRHQNDTFDALKSAFQGGSGTGGLRWASVGQSLARVTAKLEKPGGRRCLQAPPKLIATF